MATAGGRGPAALDPAFQAEILEKEKALERDHFAVLGVSVSASPEEIRAAYHAASRRFHPDRFFRQELGAFGPKLERIFRRLNEAHAVLSDPGKRGAYLDAHPELKPKAPSLAPERQDERRSRLSRHPYLMRAVKGREALAKAERLIEAGQTPAAIELLTEISRQEPTNTEATKLLARARQGRSQDTLARARELARTAEREGRFDEAAASWQRVAQQAPRDGEAHFRLGQLLLKQGKLEPARLHAKMAVDLAPDTIEHRLCLARVLLALDAKKLARKELDAVLAISPANAEASALVKKVRWSVRGGD